MRNLGASVGISIMQALLTSNTQKVHARLTEGLTPDNPWPALFYMAARSA